MAHRRLGTPTSTEPPLWGVHYDRSMTDMRLGPDKADAGRVTS